MAVLFELDGTLCRVEKNREELLNSCLDECGLPKISRNEYIAAHDRVSCNKKLDDRLPIFNLVFKPHGVDEEEVRRLTRLYRKRVLENLRLKNDAKRILRDIADNKVLVTNGPKEVQREKVRHLGLEPMFECIVTSGEVGVAKPDPRIFRYAENKSGCSPEIYIGNSLRHDIACAENYGIKSVYISSKHSDGVCGCLNPSYVVGSLSELREIPEIDFI